MKKNATTTADLKLRNRNKVYKYIQYAENVSKQQLVTELGMSLPTVNQNVNELFEQGLLHYSGTFASNGGRKARMISIKADAKYAIGLEIASKHIVLLTVDLNGKGRAVEKISKEFENNEAYGIFVAESIQNYIVDKKLQPENLLGVGISFPGVISMENGLILNAPTLHVNGSPLDFLTKYIAYPLIVENDASAGGFAEMHVRKAVNTLAYLMVSDGVGGALVLDGKLYEGMNKRGAEFGHMTIVKDGKICSCGKKGCLEAYISTSLLSYKNNCTINEFFDRLNTGDHATKKIWEEYLRYLCMGINNIRTIFDCEVILGGMLANYVGEYIDDIRSYLGKVGIFESNADYLELSAFTSNGAAVGAALQLIDRFINSI